LHSPWFSIGGSAEAHSSRPYKVAPLDAPFAKYATRVMRPYH